MNYLKGKYSQATLVSTFASRTRQRTGQSLQKSLQVLLPKKNDFLKFPSLPKFFKTANAQTDTTKSAAQQNQADSEFQTRWTRTPAANSVLPQLAVTCKIEADCYYQTFVQVDSEVLRNRQLRQHAKRYGPLISVQYGF
jgi:hypothetical protein